MPTTPANGITLHYERFGPADAPVILLVMGLGAQLIRWPRPLCDTLVARGFQVIRFDNRDCGQSTACHALGLPDFRAYQATGVFPALPYTLEVMADDALGLLDALGIDQAHLVGASMGGAIAQILAARHPSRVLSLTSIMASSGHPSLPPPIPAAQVALFAPLPADKSRASMVADAMARFRAVASPGFPTSDAELVALFGSEYDRGFNPAGVARQLAAILAHGDRRPLLARIACPTVVLHGRDDPLIPFACGEDVARHVPGAELIGVVGMGHDFPLQLTSVFADAIEQAAT